MNYPKGFKIFDKIKKSIYYITVLCSVFCSMYALAKPVDKPYLEISPTVCVTESEQKICQFNIKINFTLAPFKELCLEITNLPQYTQCYTQKGVIKEHLKLQTSHSIKIQLIDPLTNKVVKEQELSIARYKASDYRIKRRFGWSL